MKTDTTYPGYRTSGDSPRIEQIRATLSMLRELRAWRAAGAAAEGTIHDPAWLVEQAINRRGGGIEEPGADAGRVVAAPNHHGKFPRHARGDFQRSLFQHAWEINSGAVLVRGAGGARVGRGRVRVYVSSLGAARGYLVRRIPGRFSRLGYDD